MRIAELIVRVLDSSSTHAAAGPLTRLTNDTHAEISIILSSVAEASLSTLRLSRSQLMELLDAELASHKILTRIDYECIPRPLSSGVFVLLTKRGPTILVESVGAHFLPHRKVELWSQLCRTYLDAYKLPFRRKAAVINPGADCVHDERQRVRHDSRSHRNRDWFKLGLPRFPQDWQRQQRVRRQQ